MDTNTKNTIINYMRTRYEAYIDRDSNELNCDALVKDCMIKFTKYTDTTYSSVDAYPVYSELMQIAYCIECTRS